MDRGSYVPCVLGDACNEDVIAKKLSEDHLKCYHLFLKFLRSRVRDSNIHSACERIDLDVDLTLNRVQGITCHDNRQEERSLYWKFTVGGQIAVKTLVSYGLHYSCTLYWNGCTVNSEHIGLLWTVLITVVLSIGSLLWVDR